MFYNNRGRMFYNNRARMLYMLARFSSATFLPTGFAPKTPFG